MLIQNTISFTSIIKEKVKKEKHIEEKQEYDEERQAKFEYQYPSNTDINLQVAHIWQGQILS